MRFRRSATRLTAGQRQKLRDSFAAVQKIDDDRGYGYHAGIHGLPLPIGCDNAHGTDYFLPWHRAYLYFFERALRDQVPDAMLTWWDWRTGPTHAAQIPKAFATKTVDRKRNPLFSATVSPLAIQQGGNTVPATTVREPGAPGAPPLPSFQDVTDVLALNDFVDFTAQVEQLHNAVHVWVGGHMGPDRLRGVRPDLLGPPHHDRPAVAAVAAAPPRLAAACEHPRRGAAAVPNDRAADALGHRPGLRLRRGLVLDPDAMNTTTSALELPELEDAKELSRADLVFYGVDHAARPTRRGVFINNPKADAETERVDEQGYAGSFAVFGHNGCFGDEGHCLPGQRATDEFDLRAPHPLRALTRTLIATDAIRRALIEPAVQEVTVTVVAVTPDDGFPKAGPEPGHFDYVRLLTYES